MTLTLESLRRASRSYVQGPAPYSAEDVAQRAFADQTCIAHTCHTMWREAVLAGTVPTDTCSLCGGRNRHGQGDHHMCRARRRHGLRIERLDITDTPCDCSPCAKERGERH